MREVYNQVLDKLFMSHALTIVCIINLPLRVWLIPNS